MFNDPEVIVPLSYWVDSRHNLLWLTCQGHVSLQEVSDFRRRIREETGARHDAIADIRGVSSSDITGEHLRYLARQQGPPDLPPRKIAIITKANDPQFGRARIYEMTANSQPEARNDVAVFTSVSEAMKWLAGHSEAADASGF